MKICPYCLAEHDRPGVAVFCCEEHAKATARQNARAKGKGDRVLARLRRARAAVEGEKQLWRDIAMGRTTPEVYAESQKGRRKKRG